MPAETVERIKQDVSKHRLVVFKGLGKLSADAQLKVRAVNGHAEHAGTWVWARRWVCWGDRCTGRGLRKGTGGRGEGPWTDRTGTGMGVIADAQLNVRYSVVQCTDC